MKIKCSCCGYKLDDEQARCPRCNTIVRKAKGCESCKGCSLFKRCNVSNK